MAFSSAHPAGITDEGLYLRARFLLAGALAVAAIYDRLWGGELLGNPVFWFLWAVLLLGTLLLWSENRRRERPVSRVLVILAAPDAIVIAGLSYLLHGSSDGFYPIALMLPIAYALMTSRRTTFAMSIAVMAAYAVGHSMAHSLGGQQLVMTAMKLAAIPLISLMVSSSVAKQRARESEAENAIAEKAALNEVLEQRLTELHAVSEITEMVHSTLDFDKVGPVVLEIIGKVLGVQACCMFVIDKIESETLFSASYGKSAKMPTFESLDDPELEDHFACVTAYDHNDVMVLFCASAEEFNRFTSEDRLVLGAVASELVVAVENSRLYKLTRTLAITDELTGLANYRHLQQRLDEEIERSRRYGKRMSFIMLDVDDFKGFNDTQGHIAGDKALAELGKLVTQSVREVDLVARYGGEEFSIVLPETDAPGAFVVAEKVREAVASHAFPDADGALTCGMTVSIGVATFPVHASDKEMLLREADDALYRAKSGGKNRVRTPRHNPMVPEGERPTSPQPEPSADASATTDTDTTGEATT